MKNIIFILLFCTGMVQAQIINFPDANFKAKLLAASPSNQIASTETPNIYGSVSTYHKIDTNNDGEIQVSEAILIKYLNVSSSNISNLTGIETFSNLQTLDCDSNQLPSLNASGLTNLKYLDCDSNQLTSLNVSGLSNLKNLNCGTNQLTSLNVSGLSNLQGFICYSNQLTSLNVSDLSNLSSLSCTLNQLTSLNVSGLTNLIYLNCSYNELSTLNISSLTNLQSLYCHTNQLTSLFIKNGRNESTLDFSNNANLQFICADEGQIAAVQAQVGSNVVVNSYCSFTPGGNYNTITGVTHYDSNTNGCDASDSVFQHVIYNINDGTNQGATFSNNTGTYNFYTQTGTFTVTPQFENPTYFNATPINAIQTFTNNNNNIATHNYCITPNGIKNDVEVVLSPTVPARPGFDAHYRLVFKNKGNQPLSGTIVLNFDDDRLDFVSSNPSTTNQQPSTLTWNYTNLLPFENRAIDIILNVNSPQETPAVNIGDVLPFTTIINPVTGDEIPADNTFTFNQIVVGAYDPNDITCLQGETVDPAFIGQFLHYQIRFENTGNFPAENVVVAYFVNTNDYDINTLQILNTSHNQLYTRITGNKIEFIFEDINLAPSAGGGGHGTIIIKMKTKNNLVLGDAVTKQANIYFDYNFPIATNEAETIFQTLSIGDTLSLEDVFIYPNPAKDILNIKTKTSIKKVELFDNQGRVLQTHFHNSLETSIELNKYDTGIYFIKVYTENGVGTQKVLKQ